MYTKTDNGATQYEHSGNHAVEFFSKAGSMYVTRKKPDAGTPIELFKTLWRGGDHETAMKLLFWLRDPRGGAGNRSGFRTCLQWLVKESPEWVLANIHLIPEHGRWDDLRYLFGSDVEAVVANFWGNKIAEKDFLASKWVRVNGKKFDLPLMKALKRSKVITNDKGAFRKLVAGNRDGIVEKKMCSKEWKGINFSHVPSRAMSMFTKAFERNAPKQFETWKEALVKGSDPKVKVNASVLMPHDLVKNMKGMGNKDVANAQFEALPNYMKDTDLRILPLCDTSWSMDTPIGESRNVKAMDVSKALGLYCSDKIGKGNPFYRYFMEFESESTLHNWVDMKPSDALGLFRNNCGSTNITGALDTILKHAQMFNATDEQIPNCLLIISDMQFDNSGRSWGAGSTSTGPEVTRAIDKWVKAGYSRPKVVYWNTCGKEGSPERSTSKDIGLVSGFSPSILGSILGGTDFTPMGIMKEAIKKYNVVIPE